MKIEKHDDGKKGYFELLDDKKQLGKMTFTWAGPKKFIIDHTEVDPGYKGEGLGRKLVKAGVDFAKENKLKIIPLCPFAKKIIEKNEEFQEVLA